MISMMFGPDIEGVVQNGSRVMDRIQEKSMVFMEKYGREGKYVILDAKSYLDLVAYFHCQTTYPNDNPFPVNKETTMHTACGPLTLIVLPQKNQRIQVISGDSMFTAFETLRD